MTSITDIKNTYSKIRSDIQARLAEFKILGDQASDADLFCELVFCLFTPQSKARVCAAAVTDLQEKQLVLAGSEKVLGKELNTVRFRYTKAKNVIEARKLFIKDGNVEIRSKLEQFKDPKDARHWLVENVRGMGYKEASHFLRNIGKGKDLAILDRHILKNLVRLGVINEIPSSMSGKKYLEIEEKMAKFAKHQKIPMDHLDLVLWYNETGEIFK